MFSHKSFAGINLNTIGLKELLGHISVAVNVGTLCLPVSMVRDSGDRKF